MKMPEYTKSEAKEWAREKFVGVENVLTPSFKNLDGMLLLDEAGVRHDVRGCIGHGFFASTVGVEGVPLIGHELVLRPFYQIANDEAKDRILLDAYVCNNTLEEQISNLKIAEEEGIDSVMVGFSPSFYPKSENDILEYFQTICDNTNLAVVAYPSHKYNFERFHPSSFSPKLIDRIADIENVVAMKLGVPNLPHQWESIKRCGHKILLNSPVVSWWPLFVMELGVKWAGSAPYEYMQTQEDQRLVKHFDKLLQGDWEGAMELFWEMAPARNVFEGFIMPTVEVGNYNYMHWKYMGWLTGMNGGPIPLSTARLFQKDMETMKQGLIQSGINPREPDEEFYVGRVNF